MKAHPFKIIVKWPDRAPSEYAVDEYEVHFDVSSGFVHCKTKSDDGTQRWIVVQEGSLTVIENDE